MEKKEMILKTVQLMIEVAKDLMRLSESVRAVCEHISEGLSVEAKETPKAISQKKEEQNPITLEKVRSTLAVKSQAGYTAQVRSAIKKFGAERLSDVKPEDYAELLKEAEEIGNE